MSLNTSLSIAVQALGASTGALQTINNNIANVNTPGYSRQTAVLQSAPPTQDGLGDGVVLEGFQSVRSELLQRQISQQTQDQTSANAQLGALQQIQPVFTTSTQDIGTQMSALFSSLSSLSTDPTSSALRQGVLTAAQGLATAFNSVSNSLNSVQTGLNTQVTTDVSQINALTKQIADLNSQITALKNNGQDGGTLQDHQEQMVLSLAKLTGLAVTKTESGDTLTTGNGTPLVVGSKSFALQTTTGSDGMQHVLDSYGTDVTATLKGGDLGGTIQMRDKTIPGLLNGLDTLANQVGNAFNTAQAAGFDQTGAAGGNLFNVSATVAGSAGSISLAATNTSAIAASSDGSAGSNGNLANMIGLQSAALPSGDTPVATYAGLVYKVGSLTASASAESSATTASLLQLNDQRSSVSGVSIDEESTNLIRFQQAYEAAARVVTVINSLFGVTMSMGTGA